MQIIQKKGSMKTYFVINIRERLNLYIYITFNICIFASASENGALILFQKNDFENFKKTGKHFNIFVFLIKTSCQSKESPLQSNYSFLENIFHPQPQFQITGTQSLCRILKYVFSTIPNCYRGIKTH